MADLTETVTVQGLELTVSLIVWRRYRRPMPGLIERIFDMNPGLAELGPILPVGTTFVMPVETQKRTEKVLDPIKLW